MKKSLYKLFVLSAVCTIIGGNVMAQTQPDKPEKEDTIPTEKPVPLPDTTKTPDTTRAPDTTKIPDTVKVSQQNAVTGYGDQLSKYDMSNQNVKTVLYAAVRNGLENSYHHSNKNVELKES